MTTHTEQKEPSRWEIMSRERNARVILCNSSDTYVLLDIAKSADRGLKSLRSRLMISLTADKVLPLLEEYTKNVLLLHHTVEKICTTAKIKYRVPRGIKQIISNNGGNGDDNPEKLAPEKLAVDSTDNNPLI